MGITKELKNIPGLDPEDVVVIKKIGFGSLSQLRNKSTDASVDVNTSKVSAKIKIGEYMKWAIVYCVQEASFFKGLTIADRARYIDDDKLNSDTGEFLFAEIQGLNNFGGVEELKKKSD